MFIVMPIFNIIVTSYLLLAVKAIYMIFRIVLYIVNKLNRNTNYLCIYCIARGESGFPNCVK